MGNMPTSEILQGITQISQNGPCCNRNVCYVRHASRYYIVNFDTHLSPGPMVVFVTICPFACLSVCPSVSCLSLNVAAMQAIPNNYDPLPGPQQRTTIIVSTYRPQFAMHLNNIRHIHLRCHEPERFWLWTCYGFCPYPLSRGILPHFTLASMEWLY